MAESMIFHNGFTDDYTESAEPTCPSVGYQNVNVSVPVTIIPFAHTGCAKIKCCGHPVVISDHSQCSGSKNGKCTFVISQTICVEVPVEFGAKTIIGDTYVDCLKASASDSCPHCDCADETEEE